MYSEAYKGEEKMSIAGNILSAEDWVDKKRMVTVSERTLQSGTVLHMHDYFELELITGGQGSQLLNGNTYDLRKGTVYLLSPIDFHKVVPQEQLELINVSFDSTVISPQLSNTLINHTQSLIIRLNDDELRRFELLTELLVDSCGTDDEYSKANTKNLIECLLILIVRNGNFSYGSKANDDVSPMYKCMRYLFLHFDETPSLESIAKISGYSANYFSRQFHEITGKKYIDFLTSLKLNHSKLLLTSTRESVIDISSKCGFTSLSNFNRVFKKETGFSPTQYRTQSISSK